ncbi:DNA polymerase I [Anoxybacterium hadale]|uniref:DNA polymerase I n=1 Tax=Anoxybacterium hadale TaxID=3408580 RepID=A0ACD1A8E4_9FIRM|nr:DNA polymerase I [Clostridiales bacterium]
MKIIIIDGNSLINRAYYALQRPMITKSGLYTHGVYGFLNMLNKIKMDYCPDYIAVAFDRKAPTFRHLEYTEYKAGRKKMPPELAMQMPLLKEVLDAMKVKMLEIDGFEADDIIGTVVKKAEAEGLDPLIITGDKDELQLATEKTKVIITRKGISEFDLYDEAAMIEKYGFTPEQFIDYKGLMGDQSDNIPGIPGVGEKTAMKLIQEYGSIANIIENVDQITSKSLKEKIQEHAQLAIMSRRLATINTEVPIDINFEEFKVEEPDYDTLIDLYIKLEFNSFLKKMPPRGSSAKPVFSDGGAYASDAVGSANAAAGMADGPDAANMTAANAEPGDTPAVPLLRDFSIVSSESSPLAKHYKTRDRSHLEACLLADNSGLELLRSELLEDPAAVIKVFNDRNHKAIPQVYGMSILSTKRYYFISGDQTELLKEAATLLIKTDVRLTGHNLKEDYYALLANELLPADAHSESGQLFQTAFDTMIAQYLLDPARSDYGLKSSMLEYFHEELEDEAALFKEYGQIGFLGRSEEKYMEFGQKWCLAIDGLTAVLRNKLIQEELDHVFCEVELPLIEVLASMEHCGFAVDAQELINTGIMLGEKINELTSRIYELAGEEFNINSPMQMGVILFEKLNLPFGKKTKRGYATGIEILEKLKDDYEIVALILEYRMHSKLKSTYIEGLLPLIHQDHKIHAHFQQTVAATGRISCTEPNLQNIPIRHELGRKLRKAFVPENDDFVLVGADYSQIELRILAHLSQDPELIDAFNHGDDIHKITASKVFNVPEDDVTPLQRSNAKAVNFGVIYGMSGFGLSTELNITRKEAERYIGEYFKKYTKVKEFMDGLIESCKQNGYVTTIMKRKRMVHEINASNFMVRQAGERLAMNSPIQGSAADIIKLAMIKVYQELAKEKTRSRLILQVHDELIIQTHKSELEKIKKLLEENMEHAVALSVTLSSEVSTGENWYDLK